MPLLSRSWAWPSKANSSLHTPPSVHPSELLSWTPLAPLSSLALLWFICQFCLHHFLKLFGWLGTLCRIFTSKLCFPPIMCSPTCAQEGYSSQRGHGTGLSHRTFWMCLLDDRLTAFSSLGSLVLSLRHGWHTLCSYPRHPACPTDLLPMYSWNPNWTKAPDTPRLREEFRPLPPN